jgi:hypothetical protein
LSAQIRNRRGEFWRWILEDIEQQQQADSLLHVLLEEHRAFNMRVVRIINNSFEMPMLVFSY